MDDATRIGPRKQRDGLYTYEVEHETALASYLAEVSYDVEDGDPGDRITPAMAPEIHVRAVRLTSAVGHDGLEREGLELPPFDDVRAEIEERVRDDEDLRWDMIDAANCAREDW